MREWRFKLKSRGLPRCRQETLDDFEHGVLLRVGHLEIDLGELGLAIGAKIFIAEAAHDLEISVETGDHQDLLENLRRLRQRVELAFVDPAGHEIIARAFWRGPCHKRRFNLVKALRRKMIANR